MLFGLFIISIWTMVWKGFGLWHSAKNRQKGWFIAMLVLNTAGLLPIIYLIWFKPEEETTKEVFLGTKKRRVKRMTKKRTRKTKS